MTSHDLSEPELPAHAALAAAASALPLPIVGGVLGRAARGSALRRILRRHGVRFGPGARAELSRFRVGSGKRSLSFVISRVPGVGMAARLREGVATWIAARLLERHLARSSPDAVLSEAEARRLREALDGCFEDGFSADMLRLGGQALRLSGRTLGAPFRDDLEGRPPHLRAVDTLLDGLADLPAELFSDFEARFDAALDSQP
jgi:hypothetical protein